MQAQCKDKTTPRGNEVQVHNYRSLFQSTGTARNDAFNHRRAKVQLLTYFQVGHWVASRNSAPWCCRTTAIPSAPPWHAWQKLPYTQTLLHTDTFTRRSFYTKTLFHTESFYSQTLVHTDALIDKTRYTQALLQADAFTTHTNTKWCFEIAVKRRGSEVPTLVHSTALNTFQ